MQLAKTAQADHTNAGGVPIDGCLRNRGKDIKHTLLRPTGGSESMAIISTKASREEPTQNPGSEAKSIGGKARTEHQKLPMTSTRCANSDSSDALSNKLVECLTNLALGRLRSPLEATDFDRHPEHVVNQIPGQNSPVLKLSKMEVETPSCVHGDSASNTEWREVDLVSKCP